MLSVLDKGGYDVRFPSNLPSLCCGLSFESKGFPRLADEKARELERALLAATEGGKLPVVCDTSPCVQRMKATLDPRSFTIATYAMCGFANFSSIGIQIGGIGALAPNRRHDLARLGLRAMFAGTLANFITATIAGFML
jgi:hypothetical protein